jgi:hypothetical protein
MRSGGIASIISFMHDRDRGCYEELDLKANDINEFLEAQGFNVARIPWKDPHYSRSDTATVRQNLEHCRARAKRALRLGCSARPQASRSSPGSLRSARLPATRSPACGAKDCDD